MNADKSCHELSAEDITETLIPTMSASQPMADTMCPLCATTECQNSAPFDTLKASVGAFTAVPNEVVAIVLTYLSLQDLSSLTITNKWFRDFIRHHFVDSYPGFRSLVRPMAVSVGQHSNHSSPTSSPQHKQRIESYIQLGLLLKRMTCLLPTVERMDLLVKVLDRIERFPTVSINPQENQKMRLLFECYGQLIHKVIAGWDDSEVKYVFKTMQTIAHMEQRIQTIAKSPLGARQPIEYFVRCFYRYVCVDPSQKNNKNDTINESLFWLNRILKPHSLAVRAKLLLIMFGPLISVSPANTTVPYIGWWDLTDTFFINAGLEELGFVLYMLFRQTKTAEDKSSVILLMEEMIKIPQNWLNENMASLLFFAGDDITHQYFTSKMSTEKYAEVAQKLVYLTLIEHKLTRSTKLVYKLIEKLCSSEHKHKLMNELPIAFCEAVTEIDGAIDLEDERDITELHEIIAAQSDLMKNSLLNNFDVSSQESKQTSNESQVMSSEE